MLTACSFHRLNMLNTFALFERLAVEVDVFDVSEQEDLIKQLQYLLVELLLAF